MSQIKPICIPEEVKSRYQYKTRELIVNLNMEMEEAGFLGESGVQQYLSALRSISDVGERYKAILKAFAEALIE